VIKMDLSRQEATIIKILRYYRKKMNNETVLRIYCDNNKVCSVVYKKGCDEI